MVADNLPPTGSSNNAPHIHFPPATLTNVDSTTDNKQHDPAAKQLLADNNKLKKLRLPHPCSLNVLPSPTNKWSATTHPVKGWSFGFLGHHIFYKHFYFHLSQVFHTNAFTLSTTATTVSNGGNPQGSTELDDATGHNCAMSLNEYILFATLVLGLRPGETHNTTCSTGSFVNMLLEDFVSLVKPTAVFPLNKSSNQKALARILARFSILLLGADALTPTIVNQVWGQNKMVHKKLGGPCGNLALICRQLISLACIANNTYHLWLTTTFNGSTISSHQKLSTIFLLMFMTSFFLFTVTAPSSTSANLFLLDKTVLPSYTATFVNTPQLPYHPTSTTSSQVGIMASSSMMIAPTTPLEWKTTSSQHLDSTCLPMPAMHTIHTPPTYFFLLHPVPLSLLLHLPNVCSS
jgi:hypothetical protein